VIDRTDRIPEYIARAFHIAQSGRPGPVVLGLPEEVVFAQGAAQGIHMIPQPVLHPSEADLQIIRDALNEAERPLAIIGGGGWSDSACEDFASFAKTCHLPVAAAFRRLDLFNNADSNYIGDLGFGPNPALINRVKSADLVMLFGDRFDEVTAQSYSLLQPGQKFIHVFADAAVFGQAAHAPFAVVQAHAAPMAAALAGSLRVDGRRWAGWKEEAREDFLRWTEPKPAAAGSWKGADMTAIFAYLRDALPENAIVSTDAGNFSGWAYRFLRYRRPGRMIAPVAGAMGYGVPGAVAAALTHPDRICLGICGDGGFLMTAQELATAAHHGAKPIILVCNNNMYGTIRMHQDQIYPGRLSATSLTNPDFVQFAESFGAFGARARDAAEFPAIWEKATTCGRAAVIEIAMDPRQITTNARP
jgi:acetolactate synthase-1/2/3 large subunit